MAYSDYSQYPRGIYQSSFGASATLTVAATGTPVRLSHILISNASGGTHIIEVQDGAGNTIAAARPAPGETEDLTFGLVTDGLKVEDQTGIDANKHVMVIYYAE